MEKAYFPNQIEHIVQKYWHDHQTFATTENSNKKKYYCLSMFPYPSGNLHMGHVRNYTIGDVISRYQRMLGKNVLQPIGWDAFGLPAEQAAISNNTKPSEWTYSNICYMKNQLKLLGFAYDWNRELITCQPQYYRWEQWFFTVLYNKGLVYRKTALVNWCPYHKTVLANEQVIDNCCWRCHTQIQYKKVPQWFIKITDYADQLLSGLDTLEHWPEQVKTMQRNWIGRSEGMNIRLKIMNSHSNITIYTTQLNNFMEITYLVISIDHPIALQSAKTNSKLSDFICKYNKIFRKRNNNDAINYKKDGMPTNIYAIHPITNNKLPIWVANFVMNSDISKIGAFAACPTHNQQDLEFANKHKLPIKPMTKNLNEYFPDLMSNKFIINQKIKCRSTNNSDTLNSSYTTSSIISKILVKKGLAESKVYYRLKDWGVSRQRFWGAPIPMVMLKNGVFKPVSEDQLPIILPENIYIKNNTNNFLKKHANWIQTTYNNQIAYRDTDTFDTFIESSWYYARYTCPHYHVGMLNIKAVNYWLPIDQYIGGIEHAVMHLMYFRFYHKLMRDAGFLNSDEPAKRLLCQGMIVSDAFYYISDNNEKIWVPPTKTIIKRDSKGHIIQAIDLKGNKLIYDGMCKMSKSKNNGVDPNTIIQKYGADSVRFFIMFAAPVNSTLEWKESGIEGAQRFLKRIWNITYQHIQSGSVSNNLHINELNQTQKLIRFYVHKTIITVTEDIDRRQSFNTALSSIMKLVKKLYQIPQKRSMQDRVVLQEALSIVVRLLYPFTPHISFILWKALGHSKNIDDSEWPQADIKAIQKKETLIIIQINGKTRKKIFVPINHDKNTILEIVKKDFFSDPRFEKKQIKKIIYVPNTIINLLIE